MPCGNSSNLQGAIIRLVTVAAIFWDVGALRDIPKNGCEVDYYQTDAFRLTTQGWGKIVENHQERKRKEKESIDGLIFLFLTS